MLPDDIYYYMIVNRYLNKYDVMTLVMVDKGFYSKRQLFINILNSVNINFSYDTHDIKLVPTDIIGVLKQLETNNLLYGTPPLILRFLYPDTIKPENWATDILEIEQEGENGLITLDQVEEDKQYLQLYYTVNANITGFGTAFQIQQISILLHTLGVEHHTEYTHVHYNLTLQNNSIHNAQVKTKCGPATSPWH